MRPDTVMSLSLSPSTNTSTTLTPTTYKKITELFESEGCLETIQTLDPAAALGLSAKKSYATQDSKLTWQGGVTQVVTPGGGIKPFIVIADEALLENQENVTSNSQPQEQKEEEAEEVEEVVKAAAAVTTRRSARINKVNTADLVKDLMANEDSDSDYVPDSPRPGRRAGVKRKSSGRKASGGSASSKSYRRREEMEPEEFEKLLVRRQRNKEAAARCRKRRVDLTNKLQDEVDAFQSKRRALEEEIKTLKAQKEDLEFILEAHKHSCQLTAVPPPPPPPPLQAQVAKPSVVVAVKSEPVIVEPAGAPFLMPDSLALAAEGLEALPEAPSRPKRPVSLALTIKSKAEVSPVEAKTGVAIETPSTIIPSLSFDAVTTGLTPSCPTVASLVTSVSTPTLNTPSTCSTQQRATDLTNLTEVLAPDYVSL